MPERERINFTADRRDVAEWRKFVRDNPEYENLSHFLRGAARLESNGKSPHESQPHDQLAKQISREITSEFETLQNQIEDLQQEVGWLRKQLHDETDLNEVAREVRRNLPSSVDEIMRLQKEDQENPDEFVNTGKLADLSQVVGEDSRLVEDAITYLRNNFIDVGETTTDAGTVHYYRRE